MTNEEKAEEIYKKRIEEAAVFLFNQRGLDKESCRQAMDYILSNQWIPVDEALPDRGSVVFIRFDHGGYSVRMFTNYDRSFADVKGGNVTHWMPIPQLKGGEKWTL